MNTVTVDTVTVTIAGVDHPMRWEVKPSREFETMHPEMKGVLVAWQTCAFQPAQLFALWHICLSCKDGNPDITVRESEALLQTYFDEGHNVEDVYDLVGEAGIAGHFLKKVVTTNKEKPEDEPTGEEA